MIARLSCLDPNPNKKPPYPAETAQPAMYKNIRRNSRIIICMVHKILRAIAITTHYAILTMTWNIVKLAFRQRKLRTLRITARSSTKVASEDVATKIPKGAVKTACDGIDKPRATVPLAKAGTEPNCRNMYI